MKLLKKISEKPFVFTGIFLLLVLFVPTVALANDGEGMTLMGRMVWGLVNMLFGSLAAVAGLLLDHSVTEYIVGFGEIYSVGGAGFAVDSAWVTIRDFFNITFIFGLVYIGFRMILDSGDSQTKSWLIKLIMAALLVNFSLYITKFVIDVSNSIASEIVLSGAFYDTPTDKISISGAFMDSMGANGVFGQKLNLGKDSQWGYIFGAMILFIVMIFAFGAGAILLIIRFAVLLLYMIFSPFMFIGWVFPQLQKYTTQYWSGFLGRAFFAPIYLLLLYVSLSIIQGMFGKAENENGVQDILGITGPADANRLETVNSVNGLPIFIISSILLIASIVVAQKMGANGADAVISAGKKTANKARGSLQRGAGNMTAGSAGFVGRKFVGGAGNMIAENANVQRLARQKGLKGFVGKAIAGGADVARTSSFDVRNVAGLGQATGTGQGQKGGYVAAQKAKAKKDKERSDRISTQEDERLYEDAGQGVANIKQEYDKLIENLNQTMSDLSKATDPNERRRLYSQMKALDQEKKDIENSTSANFSDNDMKEFNYVRKNNKVISQNSYAANLERGNSSIPGLQFLLDHQANVNSAGNIRKNLSKSDTDRLIDALRERANDDNN
jgi:hypothetical protein